MPAGLRLLDEVAWLGSPVPGGRTHALLAALVAAGGGILGEDRLVEEVWGPDEVPANPGKALQVVVPAPGRRPPPRWSLAATTGTGSASPPTGSTPCCSATR